MLNATHWAMCQSKHRYPGRRGAGQAAERATERTGKAHRIYHCPYGDHWHLTSAPKRHDAPAPAALAAHEYGGLT